MSRPSTDLTSEETLRLQTWRTLACDLAPYYSTILFSLRPVRASDKTFAVDRSLRLYIGFDKVSQWTDDECAQVLIHECGHVIGDHANIADEMGIDRDPWKANIFNIAADMAINDDLAEMGMEFIERTGQLPEYIGAERHLTSLEYYSLIVEAIENAQQAQSNVGSEDGDPDDSDGDEPGQGDSGSDDGDSDGEDESQGGDDSADDEGDEDAQGGGGNSDDESDDSGQDTGQGTSEPESPADILARSCGSVAHGASTPGELDDSDSLGGEVIGATRSEIETIIAATREEMITYADSHPGVLTSGMVAEAKNEGLSLVSWKRCLSAAVTTAKRTSKRGSKQSYRRISRRFNPVIGDRRVVMPGRVSDTFNVGCIVDTSSSTREFQTGGDILREVHAIHQRVAASGGKTLVIDADTEIHDVREYRNRHSITTLTGQGGTLMDEATRAVLDDDSLMKGDDRLGALVIITDGETDYLDDPGEHSIPVIACVVSKNPDSTVAEFPVPDWMTCVKVPAALV